MVVDVYGFKKVGIYKMKQNLETRVEKGGAKSVLMDLASKVGFSINNTEDSESKESKETKDKVEFQISKNPVSHAVLSKKSEHITEMSVIMSDVEVEGNIKTGGDLDCRSTIKGDLVAKGNIVMSGTQTGNIYGLQIKFSGAQIDGNVTAEEHIAVDSNTVIKGDIHTGSILLYGRVKGNVFAQGLVSLCKNSVLAGNVQAGNISIEKGAQVTGQINMEMAKE